MKLNIWPFNRNQNQDSTLPEEVQDYYQAEKRERTSVASLLALGTLAATIVLALGLFFGGRWVYRTVFDKDDGATETAEQQTEQQDTGSTPAPATDSNQNQNDTQGAATPPSNNTGTSPSTTSGTNSTPLPRTGPEEDL